MSKIFIHIFILTAYFLLSPVAADTRQDNYDKTNLSFAGSFKDIRDRRLQKLLYKMFLHNCDLKQMASTIKRMQAEFAVSKSALYPVVTLSTSSGILTENVFDNSTNRGDYQISLPVSYELDVWNRLKNQSKAALFKSEAAVDDRESLAITLSAELMERYYCGLYLRKQIALFDRALQLAEKINRITQYRYDAGMINKNELYSSKQTIRELSVRQASIKSELSHLEHSLKIIIGEYPENGWLHGTFAIPAWLKNIPANLSSEIVRQRPDLRSIQLRLFSASHQVYATQKAAFPSFYLTSQAQTSSDELKKLTCGTSASLSAFTKVHIPIFDGHRNKADYESRIFEKEELSEEYNQTLLTAFSEIETALSNGQYQTEIITDLENRNKLMKQELAIIKMRYNAGMESLLKLLSANHDVIFAEIELGKAQLQLISYRIQLIRSLGYVWW